MQACQQVSAQSPLLWNKFISQYNLSDIQAEQFAQYALMLKEWNEIHNLTAITTIDGILTDHFMDSLSVCGAFDFTAIRGMCDVGSGGGFPGIPLKILYPDIPSVLIEVNAKKVEFLNEVITKLGLNGIEVNSRDWRTFLRSTNREIDLFCARASLRPDELVRALSDDACPYNKATIVYWASAHWEIGPKEAKFFVREFDYTVQGKKRRLVIFKRP